MLVAEVHVRIGLLALMLFGCGTIVLERYQDTGDPLDPFGLCSHVDDHFTLLCTDDELVRADCIRECVEVGGSSLGPWPDVESCLHAPSVPLSCDEMIRCMQENQVACVTDLEP